MCITINYFRITILSVLFILNYGIVLQSDPKFNIVNFNQNFNYDKFRFYNISKYVTYWLYTRENPVGQCLITSDSNVLQATNFNVKNPIKVIVHGWLGSEDEKHGLCTRMKNAYLQVGKYNVICVNWIQLSFYIQYKVAKHNAKYIGYDIAQVLKKITKNTTEGFENIHLIGHSMGAHIVGFTGKMLTGQIPRITGLDPAKILYEGSEPMYRIDRTDAKFVDIIHTDTNSFGLGGILGHIDFYPNGGISQPNCSYDDKVTGGACSHNRAYHYFVDTILIKEAYKALQCSSWAEYKMGKCTKFDNITYMGEYADLKHTGRYFLFPFYMHRIKSTYN